MPLRFALSGRSAAAAAAGVCCGVAWSTSSLSASASSKKKVVVTGASGMIAQLALPALRERYDVVALDIRESPGVHKCDLLGSREEIRPFFKGAYAVFHSAFVPPPKDVSISTSSFLASNIKGGSAEQKQETQRDGPDRLFAAEHSNVRMAFNVYQTAVEEGVERVIVSSSNHAADWWEPMILKGEYDTIDPEGLARSDNYYGWAKIAYENLGFMFATGQMNNGVKLANVQIRIGGPRETDVAGCPLGDLKCMRRALGAYMSQRDLQQMVIKSIETPSIDDGDGVPFQIFYGISGNDHNFWCVSPSVSLLTAHPFTDCSVATTLTCMTATLLIIFIIVASV